MEALNPKPTRNPVPIENRPPEPVWHLGGVSPTPSPFGGAEPHPDPEIELDGCVRFGARRHTDDECQWSGTALANKLEGAQAPRELPLGHGLRLPPLGHGPQAIHVWRVRSFTTP